MREETQQEPTCVYCGKPITREQRPSVEISPGKEAHMECYADQMDKEENELGR